LAAVCCFFPATWREVLTLTAQVGQDLADPADFSIPFINHAKNRFID